MKRTNNKSICTAVIAAALLCSSCGNHDTYIENNELQDNITQSDENTGENTDDNEIPSDSAAESNNTDTAENEDNGDNENNENNDSTQTGAVTIETSTIENSDTAEDGTTIYTMSYVQPNVTIDGNDTASAKINADIQTRIDAFTTDNTLRNEASEYYNISLTEDDYYFNEYSETLDFETVRSDTNVISFITTVYSYAGGAHGNYGRFGINYDTKTGELIDFSELTDDADKFRNDTLEYNRGLAATDEYKERMFSEDMLDSSELENVLYADEKWYLSNDGLVFISNPYELGPYAAGVIEFVIPYDELGEIGLKDGYDIP